LAVLINNCDAELKNWYISRKIFQCPTCADKFFDKEKMNEHISTAHEGKEM